MSHFLKYINSKSTILGFTVVILLSAAIVISLMIQVDVWSRAAFDLVKKNSQQMRLVISMRDVVQKRELSIQRMLSMHDAFDRDAESTRFYNLAGVYAHAREQLLKTSSSDALFNSILRVDEAVASAYPLHEQLVEMLVVGGSSEKASEETSEEANKEVNENTRKETLRRIIMHGREGSSRVLTLLDEIVSNQANAHDSVVAEYEKSRQTTLIVITLIFTVITGIAIYALRLSCRQFKKISRLTIIDDVSGTYNRRYFDMVLEEEWKRSMREYTPLSLLMVDIDFFKAYNDNFGHQMGDVCLYTVGKILSGQLKRATDFTARYGGEEFVIVLPNTQVEYARLLAERLRRSVEEARIKAGNEEVSPWVTVSIGVATTTAEYEQSSAVLVKAADRCLYESKSKGRNRVSDKMLDDLE